MKHGQLDEIDFLVRSPGRLDVLSSLRDEPRSRDDLLSLSDVSRVTMSRILRDFEERGWLVRVNGEYESTSKGAFVADEVGRLTANFRTIRGEEALLDWFPAELFAFNHHRLADGHAIESDHSNLDECIQHVVDLFEQSDEYRVVGNGMAGAIADATWRATVQGDLVFEGVLDFGAVEVIASNPRMREQMLEVIAQENANLYRFDWRGELRDRYGWDGEFGFQIADDTVSLVGNGGLVDTTDEGVWSWARGFFESLLRRAEPVGTEVFSERSPTDNGQRLEPDSFTR